MTLTDVLQRRIRARKDDVEDETVEDSSSELETAHSGQSNGKDDSNASDDAEGDEEGGSSGNEHQEEEKDDDASLVEFPQSSTRD